MTCASSVVSTQMEAEVWSTYLINGPRTSGVLVTNTVLPGGGQVCTVGEGQAWSRVKLGRFPAGGSGGHMGVSMKDEQAGGRADNSEWIDRAVRVGLVS